MKIASGVVTFSPKEGNRPSSVKTDNEGSGSFATASRTGIYD
jgi:hypothetical protein